MKKKTNQQCCEEKGVFMSLKSVKGLRELYNCISVLVSTEPYDWQPDHCLKCPRLAQTLCVMNKNSKCVSGHSHQDLWSPPSRLEILIANEKATFPDDLELKRIGARDLFKDWHALFFHWNIRVWKFITLCTWVTAREKRALSFIEVYVANLA